MNSVRCQIKKIIHILDYILCKKNLLKISESNQVYLLTHIYLHLTKKHNLCLLIFIKVRVYQRLIIEVTG
jgi:hypothetical protein